MLMPKRVKYRKQMRGRMRGKATRGANVQFGEFALQALEPAWITSARSRLPAAPSSATSSAGVASGSGSSPTSL